MSIVESGSLRESKPEFEMSDYGYRLFEEAFAIQDSERRRHRVAELMKSVYDLGAGDLRRSIKDLLKIEW